MVRCGGVAQLVEQRTHKPRVPRSIRGTATKPAMIDDSSAVTLFPQSAGGANSFPECLFPVSSASSPQSALLFRT